MQITIFAKRRTTKEGKHFYSFLTRLTNKRTGEEVTAVVKFREACKQVLQGDECPINIVVDKKSASLSEKKISDKEGHELISRTLWVSDWRRGSDYVDNSMDDYC